MSEERTRILKMLEEGKISSQEANELLESLDGSSRQENKATNPRFLKIRVVEEGEEKVNISLPIMLVKSFMNFIPDEARNKMEDKNINLEAIIDGMQADNGSSTLVDIEEDGEHVEIKIV